MTGPTKYPRPYVAMRKPGQRLKDHGARQREREWTAYHATWQRPIDELVCTAAAFYNLRRNVLVLNRKQTARLLRVGVKSVLNWETGAHPVPFYAYLALILIAESEHYRLASFAWRDWNFIDRMSEDSFAKQKIITEIVNFQTGAHFTPDELNRFHFLLLQAGALEAEVAKANAKVDALTQENSEIRELFRVDGVTDEVHAMRDRLAELLGKINTAEVLQLRQEEESQRSAA